jgi:hypothetical protein
MLVTILSVKDKYGNDYIKAVGCEKSKAILCQNRTNYELKGLMNISFRKRNGESTGSKYGKDGKEIVIQFHVYQQIKEYKSKSENSQYDNHIEFYLDEDMGREFFRKMLDVIDKNSEEVNKDVIQKEKG